MCFRHLPCDPSPILIWEAAVSSSYSFSHAAPFVQCHLLQGALHDTPPKVTPSLLLSPWFISLMFPMWSLKHVVSSGKSGKCHLKKKKVLVLQLQKTTVNILVYFLLVGHLCKDISLPTCHFILLFSLMLILRLADLPILTSQLMAFQLPSASRNSPLPNRVPTASDSHLGALPTWEDFTLNLNSVSAFAGGVWRPCL